MKKLWLFFFCIHFLRPVGSLAQELPRSASFGAMVGNIDDSTSKALQLSDKSGTLLMKVMEGSSAQKAGLTGSDVLHSIGGERIINTNHFLGLLKRYHGGDKVKVEYYRNSKLRKTTIQFQSKPFEESSEYDIIYSSVKSGSNHLRTIITKPKGKAKFPAVLLIGGVGCYSIENITSKQLLSVKDWVDSLTRNGFVTMRVEKTGMGDSQGIPCNECDFNTEKQGYLDGLKQLKAMEHVKRDEVFIAGFSIGGVHAPLIAQEESVKGLIVYGTAGRNWLEYEMENSIRQNKLAGVSADSLDLYMRAEYIRLYGLYVEKKTPEQIMKEYPQTTPNFFPYPMRMEYFQQVADINIRQAWMNTKSDILALHGSTDFVSSAAEHREIAEIVNRYHPGNATYQEIPAADHWSLMAETEQISATNQQQGVNPEPLVVALKWLRRQVSK